MSVSRGDGSTEEKGTFYILIFWVDCEPLRLRSRPNSRMSPFPPPSTQSPRASAGSWATSISGCSKPPSTSRPRIDPLWSKPRPDNVKPTRSRHHDFPLRLGHHRFTDAARWLLEARPGEAMPRLVVNPSRPGRSEPRVRKRRPKQFPLMTKPRHELRKELLAKEIEALP